MNELKKLGPIAAFMYGSRLAVYVKKLEEIRVTIHFKSSNLDS